MNEINNTQPKIVKHTIRPVLIVTFLMILGYLLPLLIGTLENKYVLFSFLSEINEGANKINPISLLILTVGSSNPNLSGCEIESTYWDGFVRNRDFVGTVGLIARRYDIIEPGRIRPYYWFNIPGPIIKTLPIRGDNRQINCENGSFLAP